MSKLIDFFKWIRGDRLWEHHLKVIRSDLIRLIKIKTNNRANFQPIINNKKLLKDEYKHILKADFGLQVLIDNFKFESVLDIGCGEGAHSKMFQEAGKKVTALDYGESVYFEKNTLKDTIIADFNIYEFNEQYDCVWASHVLEHQLNPHLFLKKIYRVLSEGGVFAITVPPLKHEIVGGHLSLWNAGLLLYNLVLAGFDCRDAFVCSYGYNITAIVRKIGVEELDLVYDNGDINRIAKYLPREIAHEPFNGNIEVIIPQFLHGKII